MAAARHTSYIKKASETISGLDKRLCAVLYAYVGVGVCSAWLCVLTDISHVILLVPS